MQNAFKCQKCNARISTEDIICPRCGTDLEILLS
ncbi:MAG: zinc ribbon domain-containing protein [Nanoarchaeota archaeon]